MEFSFFSFSILLVWSRSQNTMTLNSSHICIDCCVIICLSQSVATFPLWMSMFDPKSGCVRFVVDEVALEQDFSKYLSF
jgi:hypothetical protein